MDERLSLNSVVSNGRKIRRNMFVCKVKPILEALIESLINHTKNECRERKMFENETKKEIQKYKSKK